MNRQLLGTFALSLAVAGTAQAQDDDGFSLVRYADTGWMGKLSEPVTQPYWFESPLIHTSLKAVFIRHRFPGGLQPVIGDGIDVWALQARIALTDRLALIATKDGFIQGDPNGGGDSIDGYADIAGGVKYAFINDVEGGQIVTGGITYEFTQGTREVFQGNGDGMFRPFVSAGYDYDKWNVLGTVGLNLPLDDDANSTSFDWHLHVGYEATEQLTPFFETNVITYISSGDSSSFGLVGLEGVDVANLGSQDVAGNDIITGAVGTKYAITDGVTFGAAYEFPYFTSRDDLYQERWTFDLSIYL